MIAAAGAAVESSPQVDVSPFDLGGGSAAALCLHGLTGTPYEVRPLGEALAACGMRAVGPALPGHNETPERLARVPYTAWVETTRAHLSGLRSQHERVFCVGLSLGGLLSLCLAAEEELDGVAVVATPLRLPRVVAGLVPLLRFVHPFAAKRRGSDIRDEAARRRHPSYPVMPLAGVHQLLQLQRRVRAVLHRVRAPILVAHGAHDVTARPADARSIASGVGSSRRELRILRDSAHVVPVDHDGEALCRGVAAFLRGIG